MKPYAACWSLVVALTGCAGGAEVKEEGTRSDPAGRVEVIAHRGSSAEAPENTLVAFELAVKQGADWFELDCTLCATGEVIVIHDDTVDRTSDGEGDVEKLTLAQLKRLDAGTWKDGRYARERIPTLEEALALGKGRIGVYVEVKSRAEDEALKASLLEAAGEGSVKDPEVAKRLRALLSESASKNVVLAGNVVTIIRTQEVQDEVVVQSFSPVVCAAVALEAPELRVELLVGEGWEEALRWCRVLALPGLNPGRKLIDAERAQALRAAGLKCAVWTVNDPEQMQELAEWGVDRIITDVPELALKTLQGLGRR